MYVARHITSKSNSYYYVTCYISNALPPILCTHTYICMYVATYLCKLASYSYVASSRRSYTYNMVYFTASYNEREV